MRFIVYGLGAVGGVIAGMLARAGIPVAGIARGAMLEALRHAPLHLTFVEEEYDQRIPVIARPDDIEFTAEDVVLLTMKAQDTGKALQALKFAVPPDLSGKLPIVCAQNAVSNERVAAQTFARVYGACVQIPCRYMTPGRVEAYYAPRPAFLDIGRYPAGVDATAEKIAAAFMRAGIESRAVPDIMRWKYQKLLVNLWNALESTSGEAYRDKRILAAIRREGVAALNAAGIAFASDAEDLVRRGPEQRIHPIKGVAREGSSTWQSLARGGAIEVDHLTGEIVRLARAHGVPAPVNEYFLALAEELARSGAPPASIPGRRVLEEISPYLEPLTGS